MEKSKKDNTYSTSNLFLAASLLTKNYRLIDTKLNERSLGIFYFEDRPDREELVRKYFDGTLEGSFKRFVNCLAELRDNVTALRS